MELDALKLIALVKERPALYDQQTKGHHDLYTSSKLWEEIGKEMNAPADKCHNKWKNLRTTYGRFLRTSKDSHSETGATKKRKWFFADAMEFLREHMGIHKKSLDSCDLENPDSIQDESSSEISSQSLIKEAPLQKNRLKSPAGAQSLIGPLKDYLISKTKKVDEENPMILFFKGLLPDIEILNAKRKRKLKESLVYLVNSLVDEQEKENESSQPGNLSGSKTSQNILGAPMTTNRYPTTFEDFFKK